MSPEELRNKIIEIIGEYPGAAYPIFEIDKLIQRAKKEWNQEAINIVKKVVTLIELWYNMHMRYTDKKENIAWKIYYEKAPEMKEIREFLNAPELE